MRHGSSTWRSHCRCCSPSPSLGFTESWLSGSGRSICCPRWCSREGRRTLPPISQRSSTWSPPPARINSFCQSSATRRSASSRCSRHAVNHGDCQEHGLQLNMASNKTEAAVDIRGKGRQEVLEDLSREFPVVDWSVDANSQSRGGRLGQACEYVSALGHAGFQRARLGPELAARRSGWHTMPRARRF